MTTIRQASAGERILDGDSEREATDGEQIVECGSMLLSLANAKKCRLLPDQTARRFASNLATLQSYGLGRTREAAALRRATR